MRTSPIDQISIIAEPFLKQLGIGLLDADLKSGNVDLDSSALQVFGGDPQWIEDGVAFDRLLQQVHADDRTCIRDCISTLDSTSPSFIMEYRTHPDANTTCWALVQGRGYFDENESLLRIVGIVINITALKEEEHSDIGAFPVGERLVDLADLIIAARRLIDRLHLSEMRPLIDELLLQLGMQLGAQMKSQARAALQ